MQKPMGKEENEDELKTQLTKFVLRHPGIYLYTDWMACHICIIANVEIENMKSYFPRKVCLFKYVSVCPSVLRQCIPVSSTKKENFAK